MTESNQFYLLLKELISEEIHKLDCTTPCLVDSVNADGTINIYLLPDTATIIPNILNASKYELKKGDIVLLYKVKNRINNSFIITKFKA